MAERISTVSKNYAQALLEIAAEHDSYEHIKNQLEEVAQVLHSSKDLQIVMSNSSISAAKKIDILNDFETKTNILFKLEHKLNCEIVPHWHTDKNIIAGLTFKFDDYVIDTSIRNKIENLSKNISR